MKSILLVCPAPDQSENYTAGVYYPQGVLSIASYVQRQGFESGVIDGSLVDETGILASMMDYDAVGFSANTFNYHSCLRLAEAAKSHGKYTIIGGPHVSFFGNRVLRHDYIDAVVVGDGEQAVLDFCSGNTGLITGGSQLPQPIDELDYGLIPLTTYWDNHKKLFPGIDPRFVQFLSQVGCYWREKRGCSLCSIPHSENHLVDNVWDQITRLRQSVSFKTIKDYADTWTKDSRVKELLDSRPEELADVQWLVYGRANDITRKNAALMHDMGVQSVFIGFESGNDEILRTMNKGARVRQGYDAVQYLTDFGIEVMASFTVGLKGETKETLDDTIKMASNLNDNALVSFTRCGVLMPLPGSEVYNELLSAAQYFGGQDEFNVREATEIYQDRLGELSMGELRTAARVINGLCKAPRQDKFGI